MKNRTTLYILIAIFILSILIGAAVYPLLPESAPSHWNAQGEVNGYSSRLFAVAFLPIFMLGITALLWVIPNIDPLKENISKFRGVYNGFIVFLDVFFLYLYILTLAAGLGYMINMTIWLLPAYSAMCLFCGYLVKNAKRNWFIGIRTPWTMSSDTVWAKSHQLGSKLFYGAGVITLFGLFFPEQAFLFMIVPLILAGLIPVVYSYYAYQTEIKKSSS